MLQKYFQLQQRLFLGNARTKSLLRNLDAGSKLFRQLSSKSTGFRKCCRPSLAKLAETLDTIEKAPIASRKRRIPYPLASQSSTPVAVSVRHTWLPPRHSTNKRRAQGLGKREQAQVANLVLLSQLRMFCHVAWAVLNGNPALWMVKERKVNPSTLRTDPSADPTQVPQNTCSVFL